MTILAVIGAILILGGWIWTVASGYRTSGKICAALNAILPLQPLPAVISAVLQKTAWTPVLILLAGIALFILGDGFSGGVPQ